MASAYVGEVIEGHVHRAHRVQRRVEVGLVAVSKKLAADRMSISEADPEARVRDRALGRDLETLASADVHPRRLVGVDRGDEAGRLKARHDGTLAGEVEDFILHDNRRVGLTAHDRVIVRLPCVRQLGIGTLEIHERNLEAGVRKEGERKDVHEKADSRPSRGFPASFFSVTGYIAFCIHTSLFSSPPVSNPLTPEVVRLHVPRCPSATLSDQKVGLRDFPTTSTITSTNPKSRG